MTTSLRALTRWPKAKRDAFIDSFTVEEAITFAHDWRGFWGRECVARPDGFYDGQIAPAGDWNTWVICAGRGYGKTRAGAEWVIEKAYNGARRGLIVGATATDVRDTIIEGDSGVLACAPPWFRPEYVPSKSRLVFPNGCVVNLRSAEKPARMRGPQFEFAWGDELAAWRFPDAYDQIQFGLRLGKQPQALFTTTPRPIPIMIDLFAQHAAGEGVVITKGDTFANKANLAATFIAKMLAKYANTRLGAQELYAELLMDTPGALWQRGTIEQHRVKDLPAMRRIGIGVDPSVSANPDSAETGIIVAGLGVDGEGYILADYSLQGSPQEWGEAVVHAVQEYDADVVWAEVNNGGDLVKANIASVAKDMHAGYINVQNVRATRGKYVRAEPAAGLYTQGHIHHYGYLGGLEDQQTTWTQGEKSPDRLDALVWVLWGLFDLGQDEPSPHAWSVDTTPVVSQEGRLIEKVATRQKTYDAYYDEEWIE